MDNICCIIPARYQSSRLPGKPLLVINGKTIIERTYLQTKKSQLINKIIIATDDDRIVEHVKTFGGEVIKTDIDCLNGTERICHILDKIDNKYDIIVNVQGDEPFIDHKNIDLSISKYLENKHHRDMVCTTIHYQLTELDDITNRGIGKLIVDNQDNIIYCSRAMIPHNKNGIYNPETNYYGHIGIFVFRRSYLPLYLTNGNTPAQLTEDIEWLKIIEMGYKIKSYLVEYSEIGINTTEDFNYLSKKYSN